MALIRLSWSLAAIAEVSVTTTTPWVMFCLSVVCARVITVETVSAARFSHHVCGCDPASWFPPSPTSGDEIQGESNDNDAPKRLRSKQRCDFHLSDPSRMLKHWRLGRTGCLLVGTAVAAAALIML